MSVSSAGPLPDGPGADPHDARALRRALWLQNDLLERLAEPQPVTAVVRRIGTLVHGSAALYEESGRVVASAGEAPIRLIRSELLGRGGGARRFDVGRWRVATREITLAGTGYTIMLATRRDGTLDGDGEAVLDAAARVVAAISGARALGATRHRAESARLLRALDHGVAPDDERRLWDRLRAFRFRPHRDVRAFVALPSALASPNAANDITVLDGLHEEAHVLGTGLLLRHDDQPTADLPEGAIHGLVADGVGADDVLGTLAETHDVGVSGAFAELGSLPRHARDARRAVLVARRRPDPGRDSPRAGTIVRFEQVDIATWLLAARDPREVHAKAQSRLGGLFTRSDLRATVVAYLAAGLDVPATASALFVHPNTVRYRLRRVEDLLGAPISSPAVVTELYLALHDEVADQVRAPRAVPASPPPRR